MRVLVCGSRTWRYGGKVYERLRQLPRGTHVIHGGARGADFLAATCADSLGMKVECFPADWKNEGRSAGVQRNLLMLQQQPDLVIAFWDGKSTGTAHTIREAEKRGIPVEIVS